MCKQMRHFAKKFKGKLAYPEQIFRGMDRKKLFQCTSSKDVK